MQEAMINSDVHGWSGYFHQDREGKINAGPVWGFDQSAGNSSEANVCIYNNPGVLVLRSPSFHIVRGKNDFVLHLDELEQPGIYFYKIFVGDETGYTGRFFKL